MEKVAEAIPMLMGCKLIFFQKVIKICAELLMLFDARNKPAIHKIPFYYNIFKPPNRLRIQTGVRMTHDFSKPITKSL